MHNASVHRKGFTELWVGIVVALLILLGLIKILASSPASSYVSKSTSVSMINTSNVSIEQPSFAKCFNAGTVYYIGKENCSPCRTMEYVARKINLTLVKINETEAKQMFKCINYSWSGTIPLAFGYSPKILKVIIVWNFPDNKTLSRDGYIVNETVEEQICKNIHGTPVFTNNTGERKYRYCILNQTKQYMVLWGNKYALEYLKKEILSNS